MKGKKDFLIDDKEFNIYDIPYYSVVYKDDYNRTHIATIADKNELTYIEKRYSLEKCEYVEK